MSGRALRRALLVAAVVLTAVDVALLLAAAVAAARPRVVLPEIRTRRSEAGVELTVVDDAAWRDACRAAGLPDPPDVGGADPVPVRVLRDAMQAWIDAPSAAALGRIGEIAIALERHETALDCFVAAMAEAPDEPRWVYLAGAECQTLGEAAAATALLEQAAAMEPGYATTWARLGALHLDAGRLDAAETAYRAYVEREPGVSLGYVGLGRVALARGSADEALRLLREAVARTPNDYVARRFLARALAATGDAEGARREAGVSERLRQYTGWLTFDPRLQAAHRRARTQRHLENQARLAIDADDNERLAAVLEELVARRPDDYTKHRTLGTVYRRLGRLEDADAAVARALALKPDSAATWDVEAEIAFTRGDLHAALAAIERSLELDPRSARPHDLRGRTLYRMGRAEEAIASMRTAVELEPDGVKARLALAVMLRGAGRPDAARTQLEAVLRLVPDHPVARAELDRLGG